MITQYPAFSMAESLRILININQYDDENILDLINRFKQKLDVVKTQLGMEFLDTFVSNQE